ncbi:MAG TPA: transcriptional regulator, BadM/Rrf2 family protein [Syntrophobacteraceae bacterium]|jgi:Rrf2 family transcriptional regulator, iron-sulfur cluster assembly transcription factor|nr:transcriptional regulator, BadM/Rrf2 family protein [Syntrophobacteraceae bacterium]HBZ56612.1 transcriptional regulator, BadM/Rrf2 family protein [Syntrophobacteraceae bacterium]
MKLLVSSCYGTRVVLDIARYGTDGPVTTAEIALRQNISRAYLEEILRPLQQNNLVKSYCGMKGGHQLTQKPDQVSVGEVVALYEGPTLIPCVTSCKSCKQLAQCPIRPVWKKASTVLFDHLYKITFADLLLGDHPLFDDRTKERKRT